MDLLRDALRVMGLCDRVLVSTLRAVLREQTRLYEKRFLQFASPGAPGGQVCPSPPYVSGTDDHVGRWNFTGRLDRPCSTAAKVYSGDESTRGVANSAQQHNMQCESRFHLR